MNTFEAARSIGALEVAERYAGIVPEKTGRTKVVCRCPFPDHDDKHPSCTFTISGKYAGRFICTCSHKGNSVDFVSQYMNMKPFEAAKLICKDFGLTVDNIQPTEKPVSKSAVNDAVRKLDTIAVKASVLCEIRLEQCQINGYDVYEQLVADGIINQSDELEQELDDVRDKILLQRNEIAALRDALLDAAQRDDHEELEKLLIKYATWGRKAVDSIQANRREIKQYTGAAV